MPIVLDYALARRCFEEALALALSKTSLPPEWMDRARKVGSARSKTFVAMLGTALLAKATNPSIDSFALKARDYPNAYSARSLCKDVLVPSAVRGGVHLGTTGREPLNNQPFFRHERVGPDMAVHPGNRLHLDYLCETLERAQSLDGQQALLALAGFIRVRLEGASPTSAVELGERTLGLPELTRASGAYIVRNPEGGKRGQAFIAAALDLVFTHVHTARVNDPSRRWPGDVVVTQGTSFATFTLAVEVKQRQASATEIAQFVARLDDFGVRRGAVATLDPSQAPLPVDQLRAEAWQRHRVHLTVFGDVADVLEAALMWSVLPLGEALAKFPLLMATRLQELEVSPDGVSDWKHLFDLT